MAQAENILPFPSQKITWEAIEVDFKKVMKRFDERRKTVAVAMKFIAMSPEELKTAYATLVDDPHVGRQVVTSMVDDFAEVEGAFLVLSELMGSIAARFDAAQNSLI